MDTPVDGSKENLTSMLKPLAGKMPPFPEEWQDVSKPMPEVQSISPEEIERYLSECEAQAQRPIHPSNLDFKRFAMLNCDDTLQNTGLEGDLLTRWAGRLLPFLKESAQWDPDVDQVQLAEAIELMEQVSTTSAESIYTTDKLTLYVQQLQGKIEALKPGQKLAFSGGYSLEGVGHAMAYLIQKNQDGTYSFSIINSGDGVSLHAEVAVGSKSKHYPCITWKGLDRRDLSDSLLFGLSTIDSQIVNESFDSDVIYQLVAANLKGCEVDTSFDEEKLFTPQRSGTCALRAGMALLRLTLSKESYKKLVYHINTVSCRQVAEGRYDADLQMPGQKGHTARVLVKSASRNLMHLVTKRIEKGISTEEQEKDVIMLAAALRHKADAFEREQQELLGAVVIEQDVDHDVKDAVRGKDPAPVPADQPPQIVVIPDVQTYETFTQPGQLNEALFAGLQERLEKTQKSGAGRRAHIEEFARALPLDIHSPVWRVDKADGEKLLANLMELTEQYNKNVVGLTKKCQLQRQKNTAHALYIAMYCVCHQLDPEMARAFGTRSGLVNESVPIHYFATPEEFERYNQVMSFHKSTGSEFKLSWDLERSSFNASKATGILGYFYYHIFTQKRGEVEKHFKQETLSLKLAFSFVNGTYNNSWGWQGGDKQDKLNIPVFRMMQKAYVHIARVESSRDGLSLVAYDYPNTNQVTISNGADPGQTSVQDISVGDYAPRYYANSYEEFQKRETAYSGTRFEGVTRGDRDKIHNDGLTKERLGTVLRKFSYANRQLRPIDLIGYARRQFADFDTPSTRVVFEQQLFKMAKDGGPSYPHGLFDEHFKQEAMKFLEEQRLSQAHTIDNESIQRALFLIRIATQILTFAPRGAEHDEFKAFLTKYVNEFLAAIPVDKLDENGQAAAYLHKALFQSLRFVQGEADHNEVVYAWLNMLHNKLKDEPLRKEYGYILAVVEERIIPNLTKLIPQDLEGMAQFSTRVFNEPCVKYTSEGLSLTLENEQGAEAKLCLLTGDLHSYGTTTKTPFPLDVLYALDDFKEVIDKDDPEYACTFAPTCLEIHTSKGDFKVFYSPNRPQNRQFVIKKVLETGELVTQINGLDASKLYSVVVTDTSVSSDIPLPIIDECQFWDAGEGRVVLTSIETGEILYFDRPGACLETKDGGKIKKLSEQTCVIRHIEAPDFAYIIEYPDHSKLVLPRFKDVCFIKTAGSDDWRMEGETSYKISLSESRNLGYFQHYFFLESDAGKKFAVVPRLNFRNEKGFKSFPLFRREKYNFRNANRGVPKVPLGREEVVLIPVAGDKFSPARPRDRLTTAWIYLAMRDYKEALHHLQRVSIVDLSSKATADEARRFIALAAGADASPEAIGLATKLQYMIARSKGQSSDSLKHTYMQYLNQLGNIPEDYRLCQQEEEWFVSAIAQATEDKVVYREKVLKSRDVRRADHEDLEISELKAKFSASFKRFEVELPKELPHPHDGVVSTPYRLNDFYSFITDLNNHQGTFPQFYSLCIEAKRNPALFHQLEAWLSPAILLYPQTRSQAGFLWKILHSRSQEPYLAPKKNSWSYTDFSAWEQTIARNHGIAFGGKFFLEFSYPASEVEFPVDVRGQSRAFTRLRETTRQPVRIDAGMVVDEGLVSKTFYTDGLHEKRETLLAACEQTVRYPEEADHYGDGSELEMAPEEPMDASLSGLQDPREKWLGIETIAKDEFLAGYKKTRKNREGRKVPKLTLGAVQVHLQDVQRGKEKRKELVSQLERQMLLLANHVDKEAAMRADIDTLGGIGKKIGVQEMLYLFFCRQKEGYKRANPHLKDEQVEALHNLAAQFFRAAIEDRQLSRIEGLLQKTEAAMQQNGWDKTEEAFANGVPLDPGFTDVLYQLLEAASQRSDYSLQEQPERLVFEYAMEIMLRTSPNQVSSLKFLMDAILKGQNPSIQFRMGGGKTSVFMVYLLALIAMKQNNIGILMTPLFQLEAVEGMLRENLRKTFGVELRTLKLERKELDLAKLQEVSRILQELQSGADYLSPKVVMLCPETIQSIELEYYITLNDMLAMEDPTKEMTPEGLAKLEELRQILIKLKEHGVVLADETHILLNINHELNFPIGIPEKVNRSMINLVLEIGKILNQPRFRERLHLHTNTQAKHFDEKVWRREILPELVEELAKYEGLALDDDEQKESLPAYIKGEIDPTLEEMMEDKVFRPTEAQRKHFNFLKYLRELSESEDEEEKSAAGMIALAKDVLSSLLPYVLSKKTANFDYGRARNTTKPGETVPYVTADTPSTNKFGNEVEELVLGCLTTVIYGVEEAQVKYIIDEYVAAADFDTKVLGLQYEDTRPVQECRELFGIAPHEFEDEEIRARVMDKIRQSTEKTFLVQGRTFFAFLEKYKVRLNSNAMSTVSLTKQFIAMSGTPPVGLFHHSLQHREAVLMDETVNSDVMQSVMSKGHPIEIVKGTGRDGIVEPQDIIDRVMADESLTGLLDLGGVTKDIGNDAAAKKIVEKLPEGMKGVIYFTSFDGSATSDHPALLLKGEEQPQPLISLEKKVLKDKYGLDEGDFFLFLDRRHCVGIDVPAKADAVFASTWEFGIPMSEASQGWARLRKLDNSQAVKVFVGEDEAKLYPEMGGKSFMEQDTITRFKMLHKQALRREGQELGMKKLKSTRKMLTNAVVCALRRYLLSREITLENFRESQRIIEACEPYLFIHETDDLYKAYGSLEKEVDTIELLEKEQEQLIARLRKDVEAKKLPEKVLEEVLEEHALIIKLAKDAKREFSEKTAKAVARLKEMEGGRGMEVETVNYVEEVQEVQQEVNEEIEQEINSMQGNYTLHAREQGYFSPESFIKGQMQAFEGVVVRDSLSMIDVFGQRGLEHKRYSHPYGLAFSKGLRFSTAALWPYTEKVSLLDRRFPPIQYLMVMKDEKTQANRAVIVSQAQAEELKKHINQSKLDNVWLVLPNGELHAGLRETFPSQDEDAKFLMVEFNLLAGNLNYMFTHITDYLHWIESELDRVADHESMKFRILDVLYHKYRANYTSNHRLLLDFDEVRKRVYEGDDSEMVSKFAGIEPEEIQAWTSANKGIVKYLSTEEQVQALPDELLKSVNYKQARLLSKEQVVKITSQRVIRALPKSILEQFRFRELPQAICDVLSDKQLAYFCDMTMYNEAVIPRDKWKALNPSPLRCFRQSLRHIRVADLSDMQVVTAYCLPAEISEEDLKGQKRSLVEEEYKRVRKERASDIYASGRLNTIEDARAVDYLLAHTPSICTDKMAKSIKDVVILQGMGANALRELAFLHVPMATLEQAAKDPASVTRFQACKEPRVLSRLIYAGFTNLKDKQVALLTTIDDITKLPAPLHLSVSSALAKRMPAELITKEFIDRHYQVMLVDGQIKGLDEELIKHYLTKTGGACSGFSRIRAKSPSLVERFLSCGMRVGELGDDDIKLLSDEKWINKLTTGQLGKLSKEQVAKITSADILAKLPREKVAEIPVNHLTEEVIEKVARSLDLEAQVKHLDVDGLKVYFEQQTATYRSCLGDNRRVPLDIGFIEKVIEAKGEKHLVRLDVESIEDEELIAKLGEYCFTFLSQAQIEKISRVDILSRLKRHQLGYVPTSNLQRIPGSDLTEEFVGKYYAKITAEQIVGMTKEVYSRYLTLMSYNTKVLYSIKDRTFLRKVVHDWKLEHTLSQEQSKLAKIEESTAQEIAQFDQETFKCYLEVAAGKKDALEQVKDQAFLTKVEEWGHADQLTEEQVLIVHPRIYTADELRGFTLEQIEAHVKVDGTNCAAFRAINSIEDYDFLVNVQGAHQGHLVSAEQRKIANPGSYTKEEVVDFDQTKFAWYATKIRSNPQAFRQITDIDFLRKAFSWGYKELLSDEQQYLVDPSKIPTKVIEAMDEEAFKRFIQTPGLDKTNFYASSNFSFLCKVDRWGYKAELSEGQQAELDEEDVHVPQQDGQEERLRLFEQMRRFGQAENAATFAGTPSTPMSSKPFGYDLDLQEEEAPELDLPGNGKAGQDSDEERSPSPSSTLVDPAPFASPHNKHEPTNSHTIGGYFDLHDLSSRASSRSSSRSDNGSRPGSRPKFDEPGFDSPPNHGERPQHHVGAPVHHKPVGKRTGTSGGAGRHSAKGGVDVDLEVEKLHDKDTKALEEYLKKNKHANKVMRAIDDYQLLKSVMIAGFTDLTKDQVQMIELDVELSRLPKAKLDFLKPAQVKKIRAPSLVEKLGPDKVSHVSPKLAVHISKDSVSGIEDKKVFQSLSFSQLRLAKAEQIKMATIIQTVAYSVITFAHAFFSMLVALPIEVMYWPTHICSFHCFDAAHKYVKGSIEREMSFASHCFKQVFLCGMYRKESPKKGSGQKPMKERLVRAS